MTLRPRVANSPKAFVERLKFELMTLSKHVDLIHDLSFQLVEIFFASHESHPLVGQENHKGRRFAQRISSLRSLAQGSQ